MKKTVLSGLALGLSFAASVAFADPIKIVYIGKNTGNPVFRQHYRRLSGCLQGQRLRV